MSFAKKLFSSKTAAADRELREMQKRAAEKEREIEEYYAKEFNYAPLTKTASSSSSEKPEKKATKPTSTYVPHGPNSLTYQKKRHNCIAAKPMKYNLMPAGGLCM